MAIKYDYSIFKANEADTERWPYKYEQEHPLRGKFIRDRDRVMYSKEFRRLAGKTQVFVVGFDDNQRTRLTHTLEVAQISKTICNILNLDDNLTEAIAFAHDVGHTPFGHVGERTLNFIMNNCDKLKSHYTINKKNSGFKHNWQGVRVVSDLEKINDKYDGLNLTKYTLWGILFHSSYEYKTCRYSKNDKKKCNLTQANCDCTHDRKLSDNKDLGALMKLGYYYDRYSVLNDTTSWTIEALIVRIADEIAQRHHDTEDSLLAGLFDNNNLFISFKDCFKDFILEDYKLSLEEVEKHINDDLFPKYFTSFVIDFLVRHLVQNTEKNLQRILRKYNIKKDFTSKKEMIFKEENIFDIVCYDEEFKKCEVKYQDLIWNRILLSHLAQSMDAKSKFIIRRLFKAFITNPQQLPDPTIKTLFKNYDKITQKKDFNNMNIGELRNKLNELHLGDQSNIYINVLHRTICDFLAGATDSFAIKMHGSLYGTRQAFSNNGV